MNWEQRLREMILAGGALVAAACGGSTGAQADAAATSTSNSGDDALTLSGDDDGSSDGASDVVPGVQNFCCNANPDPCCPMAYCPGGIGADAAVYITCEQSWKACEAMHSSYREFTYQPDGSVCVTNPYARMKPPDGGPVDAGPGDAALTDAEVGPADASLE